MNEIVPVALSTLGLLIASLLVYLVQSRHTAEVEWRQGIESALKSLRAKDESLGADIQKTRSALAWVCGKQGLDAPVYDRSNGS